MRRMISNAAMMRKILFSRAVLALALVALLPGALSGPSCAWAADLQIHKLAVPDFKAVFGQIESRNVLPARTRIGGTLASVTVTEGSLVKKGQQIALVTDPKIALQLQATAATIKAALSQLDNAQKQFDRVQELMKHGNSAQATFDQSKTQLQVAQNQVAVAQANQKVLQQTATEGAVLAPAEGRVLTVPVSAGSVIMPGEVVARIASGPYYLRLSLPERMAPRIRKDTKVLIGSPGVLSRVDQNLTGVGTGTIVKVYPEISGGRVVADVSVPNLGSYFVNERTLVWVPIGTRQVIAVPPAAISLKNGIDYVHINVSGTVIAVAVIPGEEVAGPNGPEREILTGLHEGDQVILPSSEKSGL